jgi:hypothetical protein
MSATQNETKSAYTLNDNTHGQLEVRVQVDRQFSRASTSLRPHLFSVLITNSSVVDGVASSVPDVVGSFVVGFNVKLGFKVIGWVVGGSDLEVGVKLGLNVGFLVVGLLVVGDGGVGGGNELPQLLEILINRERQGRE